MKTTTLTRAQAWREIAKRFLTNQSLKEGICYEIDVLRWWSPTTITHPVRARMRKQIAEHLEDWYQEQPVAAFDGYVYSVGWDTGCGGFTEERAMACLWMALEAEEEEAGV